MDEVIVGNNEDNKDKESFISDEDFLKETNLTREDICGIVEASIFVSDRPISLTKIRKNFDDQISLDYLFECIKKLKDKYSQKSGISIFEVAEGYQFRTVPRFAPYLKKQTKVGQLVISPSAMEVLSIIAFEQPVTRGSIEKIRGVDCSHIIRQLIEKKMICMSGKSDEVGNPILYSTTREFLEFFNLNDLNELPLKSDIESLLAQSEMGPEKEVRELIEQRVVKNSEESLEQLEEIGAIIKSASSETHFTSSLKKELKVEGSTSKKSAFEVLEEEVWRNDIIECNKLAVNSVFPWFFDDLEEESEKKEHSLDDLIDKAQGTLLQDSDNDFES